MNDVETTLDVRLTCVYDDNDIRFLYQNVLLPLARAYAHPNVIDKLKDHILLLQPHVRHHKKQSMIFTN
jgi:hypothetical protein